MKELIERYDNGQRKYCKDIHGKEIWYNEAGQVTRIKYIDGSEDIREYNEAGICISIQIRTGDIYKYNDYHLPTYKKTKNKEEIWEYDESNKKCICHTLKEYFN